MSRINDNRTLIESLLHDSFPSATIVVAPPSLDGTKFKVISGKKSVFLYVSGEYLSDQHEPRIRRDFEVLRVSETLSANPGLHFILDNSGFASLPQDVARP
jgi:hypothetical protein